MLRHKSAVDDTKDARQFAAAGREPRLKGLDLVDRIAVSVGEKKHMGRAG